MAQNRFKAVPIPKLEPEIRKKNFSEVSLGYSQEDALKESLRCLVCKDPTCLKACPIVQNTQGYVKLMREGKFDGAMEVIMQRNPFPGSMGRVCDHQCMGACPMGKKGDPINICALKRAASDFGDYVPTIDASAKGNVAVVGAGPAGLALAYILARKGVKVTVFESMDRSGGVLLFGIPTYRLPKNVLQKDVKRVVDLDVKIEFNKHVGKDITFDELKKGYDAVFVGVGALRGKPLKVPGEDLKGVVHAIDFLKDVNLGKNPWVGKRTAVIGGGLVAADAVRVAKRLGSDSFILYRRTKHEMPMTEEEKHEIEEEGIQVIELAAPVEFKGENGQLKTIVAERMKLGEPDSSGRRKPVPTGEKFELEADMVIPAISQRYDPSVFANSEILSKFDSAKDWVQVNDRFYLVDNVYVGGDTALGPQTVAQAVRSAHIVAEEILKKLAK